MTAPVQLSFLAYRPRGWHSTPIGSSIKFALWNLRKRLFRTHENIFRSVDIAQDVRVNNRLYCASSETPWLKINFDGNPPDGRWIELMYAANLFDPLTRPVMRFISGENFCDIVLPGALFGRAVWIGLVPKGTREIWISPTNRLGPFGFRVESIRLLRTSFVAWRCLQQNPLRFFRGSLAYFVGLDYVGRTEFRRVLSGTEPAKYLRWREMQTRTFDMANFDLPRSDWDTAPQVRFVTVVENETFAGLSDLVSCLDSQPYSNWTLYVINRTRKPICDALPALSPRINQIHDNDQAAEVLGGLDDKDLIAPISVTDSTPNYALAIVADLAAQNPTIEMFYGDSEIVDSNGAIELRLRPDWSPIFFSGARYTDGVEFWRVGAIRSLSAHLTASQLVQFSSAVVNAAADQPFTVLHVRRVLRTCRSSCSALNSPRPSPLYSRTISARVYADPAASIVIPTSGSGRFLQRCVDSLLQKTSLRNIEVLVVDNSPDKIAGRQLSSVADDARFRIISDTGPFNFSKLCNDAAKLASAPILVFLNDDVEITHTDWLKPLLNWSLKPDIGAVGAKLFYPNGRVQHAGITLGIDGHAGHFQRSIESDDPGYFRRLCLPHEVSAVTGACLVVEKRKFDSVGGFDQAHLAVELNDVDLCLRLAENGWKSICTPESRLIHQESASRGTSIVPSEACLKERSYFRSRWLHKLRDDPYFHPALSLDRLDLALG